MHKTEGEKKRNVFSCLKNKNGRERESGGL